MLRCGLNVSLLQFFLFSIYKVRKKEHNQCSCEHEQSGTTGRRKRWEYTPNRRNAYPKKRSETHAEIHNQRKEQEYNKQQRKRFRSHGCQPTHNETSIERKISSKTE
jgi:hypothetical protein